MARPFSIGGSGAATMRESVWPKVQPLMFKAEDSIRQLLNALNPTDVRNDPEMRKQQAAYQKLVQAANAIEQARNLLGR